MSASFRHGVAPAQAEAQSFAAITCFAAVTWVPACAGTTTNTPAPGSRA
jgi:hypothetical protein